MVSRLYRAVTFALYQLSIVLGIAFLPVALVGNKVGIPFPLGRLVERLREAYEKAGGTA